MRHLRARMTALAAASVLSVTGCTSAVSDDDSAPAARTDENAACVDAAAEVVDAAKQPAELVVPADGVDARGALKGKKIWFITVTLNQYGTRIKDGMEAAAEALGAEVVTYDGQGLTNRFNEGISLAIAQDAAGIMLLGIDTSLVSSELAAAKRAGVPVLGLSISDADAPLPDGLIDDISAGFEQSGKQLASWMLVNSGCDAQAIWVNSPTIAAWNSQWIGGSEQFAELCPDKCSMKEIQVEISTVASDLPARLQTELTRDPDVTYVELPWDAGVPLVSSVIDSTRPGTRVLAHDGLPASLEMISKGGGQDVTVVFPPPRWMGWSAVDGIARGVAGDPPAGIDIPTRLIDASNVGDGSEDAVSPNYVDFEQSYLELWGIG